MMGTIFVLLEVDVNGCAIYRLPKDNFLVEIQSESCRNNNDGVINITVKEELDYSITIVGNGINETDNFRATYSLTSVPAGTYQVCIVGLSDTVTYEEYCFEVVVTEPEPLSVYAKMSIDGKQVVLDVKGSDFYTIELNGLVQQTSRSEVTLNLKNGTNILKVYTNIPCQGVYEEEFFVADRAILFPNPIEDIATLFFGAVVERVTIGIYSIDGALVQTMDQMVKERQMQLDFSGLSAGIYILKYNTANSNGTFKVIKK